jgi:Leucine-rich repeat (LRR) protein
LRKIEASSNMLAEITVASFRLCSKLETLTLNKNGIERIEKGAFSQAKSMIVLELKENRLLTFNEAPWSERLDTLALSFNRLTEFDDFDRCPKLTVLILNDNKIKRISPNIIKLKDLKTLDLSNNDLPDLPSEIGFINSLVRMQIEGNPLKAIRQNIRASGTNNLKTYLRDRMDVKQRQTLEKNLTPESDMSPHEQWTKLVQEFYLNGELVLRGMKLDCLHELIFDKDIKVLNLNDNKLA